MMTHPIGDYLEFSIVAVNYARGRSLITLKVLGSYYLLGRSIIEWKNYKKINKILFLENT
jgi:hypothetical protein